MMNPLSIATFLGFTGLVALVTWLITRRDDRSSNSGYFLGGRSLSFPFIAGSLLLTNLSTEQMVGLNGAAFRDGLSVMVWEVQAVIALVVMALFFLPRFLRGGIATIPEFLERRFDGGTRAIANAIFLAAYAFILLPIILYTGATGMLSILGIESIFGLGPTATLWLIVWSVGIIGGIYAITGGLRSVAVSDTLNGIGLLAGGLAIVYFGLQAVSDGTGVWSGWTILRDSHPEKMNAVGSATSSVPFSTVFTGILLLNLFYWCTNQQIIQRTFAASSLAEGQKGVLLTGALKLLGPLYLVIPGIIALHLFAGEDMKADHAYGRLVNHVLPTPLTGLFAAVLLGAVLSSFNSALNATCTLFSLGLYKASWRPEADDRAVIRAGHRFGWGIAVFAMVVAPFLASTESIFAYLQKMNGIYFIPIFAVVLLGLLHRRLPARAAKTGLIGGVSVIALGYFVPPFSGWAGAIHEYHFLGLVFVGLLVVMMVMALWRPTAAPWQPYEARAVDMTPWRGAPWAGAALVIAVVLIYALFADFGATASVPPPG